MAFVPHTQLQLKALRVAEGERYHIDYVNKDYFNGEETIEKGIGTAVPSAEGFYFNVVDPHGMEKLVMQVRITGKA